MRCGRSTSSTATPRSTRRSPSRPRRRSCSAYVAAVSVDLERLAAWMDTQGLGSGPIGDHELIAGGTQNILLRFERAGRTYVLRHPPPHKRANSDETMRREARVLSALAGSEVPHPG